MEASYDAIVVGSGFGGGVTACRLAEEGWRVCVLERGRRFGPDDFIDGPAEAPRLLWHPSLNPDGIFELRVMRDISVLTAAGVGGGSLIYANVQLRAPRDVFDQGWPADIDLAELEPYYKRTEDALEPKHTPAEPHLPKVAAFAAAGKRETKRDAELLPLAIHFGEDRENPFSGVSQQGCANLGRCNIGCPRSSMNTVAITYIAKAESDGAEVFPLHDVTRLEPRDGGGWKVDYRVLDGGGKGSVEAPVVVLSAGCLGSARILLKNKRRLPGLSPALGTRFSGNGDALGAAFDPKAEDVRGARTDYGPVMTSRLDYSDDQQFMVADGGLPDGFTGLLEIARGLSDVSIWRRRMLLRLKLLAARLGLTDQVVQPKHVDVPEPPDDGDHPITDSLVFLMIGRDPGQGRMRVTHLLRRFDIRWSKDANEPLFDRMRKATKDIARGAEAKDWFGSDGGPLGKFMTVHPLGGVPMADDPADGVVDQYGKVHGHEGLYVSDGSIIPTALGVNPSKTIAALAERNVEHLVESRKRQG
jgi:cholesterol oxidase